MMRVPMTQFIRPNGERRKILSDDLPEELTPKIKAILALGLRFTAEVIGPNVSQCIENSEEDLAIEITSNASSKKALAGLERLIREFSMAQFPKERRYVVSRLQP